VLDANLAAFHDALTRENHTLKRALTDPRLFSGIGNAYSDEILHAAKLSPVKQTRQLSDEEIARLYDATRKTLVEWVERLRSEAKEKFPEKVTAFRKDMAVHGKYKQPCPVCGSPVQRIVYAENETNYCAICQRADACSPTARSRACSRPTGPRRWRRWRRIGRRGNHTMRRKLFRAE
jgi:formamidopyrimidine-DNA glycosylase